MHTPTHIHTCIITFSLSLSFSLLLALSDSSGIEFTYTSTPRRYNAGILYLGHTLYHNMVIPPGAVNFTVLGLCSGTCTKNVSKMIKIINANFDFLKFY